MALYDVFIVSFGKAKDRKIDELETTILTNDEAHVTALAAKDTRINALEADLAPFRDYVAAHAAPAAEAPEARDGQDGGDQAGQAQGEVDNRRRDESGRFATAVDDDPAPAPAPAPADPPPDPPADESGA